MSETKSVEKTVREIRQKTRKKYTAKERAQADPDVAAGFGGQAQLVVSGQPFGFVVISHIGKIVAQFLVGDLGDIAVSPILEPHAQVAFLGLDRPGAQAFCGLELQEALRCFSNEKA